MRRILFIGALVAVGFLAWVAILSWPTLDIQAVPETWL